MKKDKYITKDNYHIEDIISNGRCLWCGRLAQQDFDFDSFAVHHKFCSKSCRIAYQEINETLREKGVE